MTESRGMKKLDIEQLGARTAASIGIGVAGVMGVTPPSVLPEAGKQLRSGISETVNARRTREENTAAAEEHDKKTQTPYGDGGASDPADPKNAANLPQLVDGPPSRIDRLKLALSETEAPTTETEHGGPEL